MLYEECKTPYEYIKRIALSNRGSDSIVLKSELLRLCTLLCTEGVDENSSKEMMIDALIKDLGVKAFAEHFYCNGLGVSSYEYQHKFNISADEVKRMERLEFIHSRGFRNFRKYGKQLKAPVYDVFEFYSMTSETVNAFLKMNPKGTRKTQVRYLDIAR